MPLDPLEKATCPCGCWWGGEPESRAVPHRRAEHGCLAHLSPAQPQATTQVWSFSLKIFCLCIWKTDLPFASHCSSTDREPGLQLVLPRGSQCWAGVSWGVPRPASGLGQVSRALCWPGFLPHGTAWSGQHVVSQQDLEVGRCFQGHCLLGVKPEPGLCRNCLFLAPRSLAWGDQTWGWGQGHSCTPSGGIQEPCSRQVVHSCGDPGSPGGA